GTGRARAARAARDRPLSRAARPRRHEPGWADSDAGLSAHSLHGPVDPAVRREAPPVRGVGRAGSRAEWAPGGAHRSRPSSRVALLPLLPPPGRFPRRPSGLGRRPPPVLGGLPEVAPPLGAEPHNQDLSRLASVPVACRRGGACPSRTQRRYAVVKLFRPFDETRRREI